MFKLFMRSSDDLFTHLAGLGANLDTAANCFETMVTDWDHREERFFAVRQTEHEGDRLLRDLHDYLKETFFVPGDREGILALTNELDDIVDKTLKIANYIVLYKLEAPNDEFTQMAKLLSACCTSLKEGLDLVGGRANRHRVEELCLHVINLEDDADKVYRNGLQRLFDHPEDLNELLKWKDLLDWADDAVDHAEHVAYRLMALNNNLH